jgi:methionyl-tRNA formyltransferase
VPPLRALVEAGHDVGPVVTRPDRRRGRGAATSPSPVKQAACELGLPVEHDVSAVTAAGVELGVVVAYGRLIQADVLDAVPMLNLHFSLLPRWRGAAPLERAILAGDETTGVCVIGVDATLDTGPVYARREVAIGERPLSALQEELADLGGRMLVELLADGRRGLPVPEPQRGEPTYAEKLAPDELRLRWDEPAVRLARVVRLGRAFTFFRGRRLRVLAASVAGPAGASAAEPAAAGGDAPGVLGPSGVVATGDGRLVLERVQPEGRAPMGAGEWLRGVRLRPGEALG